MAPSAPEAHNFNENNSNIVGNMHTKTTVTTVTTEENIIKNQPAPTNPFVNQPDVNQQLLNETKQTDGTGEWKFGIFGCFEEFSTCWQASCCPSKVQIKINEHLGPDAFNRKRRCMKCPLVWCCVVGMQRGQMRQQNNIHGHCCLDFILGCCCNSCSLVQMRREMRKPPTNV